MRLIVVKDKYFICPAGRRVLTLVTGEVPPRGLLEFEPDEGGGADFAPAGGQ